MLTKQPYRKLCSNCELQLVKPNGISKHGFTKWHKYCSSCAKSLYSKKISYKTNKNSTCEICNFKAIDKCQLDLIYLDGDEKNKEVGNIKMICANCSRIYNKNKKNILDITVDADILL
jgi:hypothetical protein